MISNGLFPIFLSFMLFSLFFDHLAEKGYGIPFLKGDNLNYYSFAFLTEPVGIYYLFLLFHSDGFILLGILVSVTLLLLLFTEVRTNLLQKATLRVFFYPMKHLFRVFRKTTSP